MNYFDKFLETELRLMLDPVVARRPPARRGRSEVSRPLPPADEALVVEAIPMVEPVVVVTRPVAPARSL